MIKYLLSLIVLTFALTACDARVIVHKHDRTSSRVVTPKFHVASIENSVAHLKGHTTGDATIRYWVNGRYDGTTWADHWGHYEVWVDLNLRVNRVKVAAFVGDEDASYTALVRNK